MRLPVNHSLARLLTLSLATALAGCGGAGGSAPASQLPAAPVANGPAADYPVTIGDPYQVDGVTYTPADQWNVDEVGYAALDTAGGSAITGAHHTLPLPSYVEVTSLETGKTILVRIERRGPKDASAVIALSPGAAEQLGASAGTPVRVRRVNPQEPERAALRAGNSAPLRMETPMSLVNVLKLKLKLPDNGASASLASAPAPEAAPDGEAQLAVAAPVPEPEPEPVDIAPDGSRRLPTPIERVPVPESEIAKDKPVPAPASVAAPEPAPIPAVAVTHGFVVQAGTYSTEDRAERVAKAIGGEVSAYGKYFRVRTGPFASRKEAEASLAKVKAAGYSDARIYTTG